ncbi:MAG TPA: heliorhodopsin HeR [Bacilli bacterium]|nr:heliorhodopsin HeR [Bacilli bacterium]
MKKEEKLKRLLVFNRNMGIAHLVQGIFMLFAALTFTKIAEYKPTIVSHFLTYDHTLGKLVNIQKDVFTLPFGILVASFLLLSAIFHFVVSSKKYQNKYLAGLKNNINRFRWYEYALSSSIMIVLIAVLFGVYDISTLILIFGLNAMMNLFGLLMEKENDLSNKVDWQAFIFGSIAGFLPWIIIVMHAFGNSVTAPWFVYAIFASYLVFFNCFAINMILQYKKVGKWQDYLYGERAYIILSLVAKTILAWLVLFGVMQP